MKVAFYLRVSTDDQTIENQRRDLDEVARRLEWDIVAVYADEGISGSKGRDQRPQFNELLKGVARKEFDLIAAWSVCRLGRSLSDLVNFLNDINNRDVDLYLHKQGLDTSTPAGRMMFQMLGVFSEFERAIISDRVKAGLARTDKVIGRPGVGDWKINRVKKQLRSGKSIRAVAELAKVSVGTVSRIRKEMAAEGLV
ncbi:resolvase [Terasakiella brassicae]|jgi:DNA invertase Pin-like site-specific DNA recombinase|uniref:Resolvase n=1 Tax=Terasakiella brassicae TaxID=1634917 RepID=A0A917FE97_9PROT|nr:recombinase family protein [Terasakiella brassicae]GGF75231.1 resolvase [Terasakiella brassicae]